MPRQLNHDDRPLCVLRYFRVDWIRFASWAEVVEPVILGIISRRVLMAVFARSLEGSDDPNELLRVFLEMIFIDAGVYLSLNIE